MEANPDRLRSNADSTVGNAAEGEEEERREEREYRPLVKSSTQFSTSSPHLPFPNPSKTPVSPSPLPRREWKGRERKWGGDAPLFDKKEEHNQPQDEVEQRDELSPPGELWLAKRRGCEGDR